MENSACGREREREGGRDMYIVRDASRVFLWISRAQLALGLFCARVSRLAPW